MIKPIGSTSHQVCKVDGVHTVRLQAQLHQRETPPLMIRRNAKGSWVPTPERYVPRHNARPQHQERTDQLERIEPLWIRAYFTIRSMPPRRQADSDNKPLERGACRVLRRTRQAFLARCRNRHPFRITPRRPTGVPEMVPEMANGESTDHIATGVNQWPKNRPGFT
jgi:hypothetical protein